MVTAELKIKRIAKKETYTIGKLYVNGIYFCDTLEDVVRPQANGKVINKVHGETAIPSGRYRVAITYSNRFKKNMIQVLNVPGFGGIRIHAGNVNSDTDGCPLVGFNKEKGKVLDSAVTSAKLFNNVKEFINDGTEVYLTVE